MPTFNPAPGRTSVRGQSSSHTAAFMDGLKPLPFICRCNQDASALQCVNVVRNEDRAGPWPISHFASPRHCHPRFAGGSLLFDRTRGRDTTKAMKTTYNGLDLPKNGQPIDYRNGQFEVPDNPIIPFIEGDGTGRDIWKASQRVFDAAVEKAYGGRRAIRWFEIFAGEKAYRQFNTWLPDDSVAAARDLRVSIKGPLTTPICGGIRSLNVALRQILDLYACVRPVKYYQGVPSPVKHPEKLNIVIYRENTEDV